MKSKKNKGLIIICVVISIFLILIGTSMLGSDKTPKYNDLCRQIDNAKEKKKDFVVVINDRGILNDVIYEFKNKYSKIALYEINKKTLKDTCFKTTLEDTGEYERLIQEESSAIIGYKSGEYGGLIAGVQTNFDRAEKYLDELDIIEIPKIESNLMYDDYKKNIKKEDYFLIAITEEKHREIVFQNMKKVFPNTTFDIFNINSEEGKKIIEDIKKITKSNSYPKIFYFKNEKLILDGDCVREYHLEQLQKEIEKLG